MPLRASFARFGGMDVTLLPAHEQARLVAAGQIGALELLEASVQRYEDLDAQLNAVVVERIDDARKRARAADQQVVDGAPLGPFHGVPVTVKDVIDWVGTPSTWGDPAHANYHPARNAVVLDRLLGAGAIVWGKTNVPLKLGDWQTYNDIYGQTNNPWDLERTPGGSSGGSAVSLAVGYAGLEIGSDIGGSIRFPAHYCGVFGHKPSFGAVSADGHTYPGQPAEVDINVVGPLARSARDLGAAMRLLSDRVLPEEPRSKLADFRVGVMLDHPYGGEQDEQMTAVLRGAIANLEAAGLTAVTADTGIDHAKAQQNYLMLNFAATSLVDDHPSHLHEAEMSHREWIRLDNERERLRQRWASYFDTVDVLLCPVTASAAPPHQTEVPFPEQMIPINGRPVSVIDQWLWAGIASGVYLPATAVPVGQTPAGLPVGLQVLAPFGHDLRGIAIAALIEEHLGGYRAPPLLLS